MIEFDVSISDAASSGAIAPVAVPVPEVRLPSRQDLEALIQAWRPADGDARTSLLVGVAEVCHLDDLRESRGLDYVDRLLAVLVRRVQGGLPPEAWMGELSQGRYVVCVPHAPVAAKEDLRDLSTHLIDLLAVPLHFEGTQHFPYAAIGWTWAMAPVVPRLVLPAALQALRNVAPTGPGAWDLQVMDGHPNTAFTALDIESGLRQAVMNQAAGGVLSLQYQPQLDLTDGRVVGLEALLRWTHPLFGSIPPDRFIPVAERTGLIEHLGAWALHAACAQAARWMRDKLPPVRVGVNLSAYQLRYTDIVGEIQAALLAHHLPPERLGVEVTESMLMHDVGAVSQTLRRIQALGVEIALDDFGTGYSSLAYLRQLPIDVVKVDRSFVHDVTADTGDVSITRAVISMAHSLQMRVLAEGVETEGQLALLVANRCDLMQGHYFSEALDAGAAGELLRSGRALSPGQVQRARRARTLLLVDDEENIVASLRRLVRRDGYTLVTANSGAQALQRLAENEVDVIVSDQRMPGMTGVEFLRRAKELYPETVRMVLSGYTELTSITDAINEGAIYKFLTKPWDDDRLRAHIAEAFQHKEMVDENRRLGQEVQETNRELATVNARLERLLAQQRERVSREEHSLSVVRELLESIPTPVIGIDTHGVIAFMNADAEDLFVEGPPIGQVVNEALAPRLIEVWQRGDGSQQSVAIDGRTFHVICRAIEGQGGTRGKVMVLTPLEAVPAQPA